MSERGKSFDNESFVREVQRLLRSLGLYAGEVDGWAGSETSAGLRRLARASEATERGGGLAAFLDAALRAFPDAKKSSVERNAPVVFAALHDRGLGDRAMLAMALGTIRAESAGFEPISEKRSPFNTPPAGAAFSLYDDRRDLGNVEPGDGARFRGRGYIQLTGRANYEAIGRLIGEELVLEPELANDSAVAARVLAAFLWRAEDRIREALARGDLTKARRVVNGGRHGLERFSDAYRIAALNIPE